MRSTSVKGERSCKEEAKRMCPREKLRDDSQDSGTGQQQQDEGNSSRMISGCNEIQQEEE